jgi:hypothetical protein
MGYKVIGYVVWWRWRRRLRRAAHKAALIIGLMGLVVAGGVIAAQRQRAAG